MSELITSELIEATYLFCVKRISNSEEAKDLSQDILCEALRAVNSGKQFYSFYSWYWKMARNKYADYIAGKQNPELPLECAAGLAADIVHPLDELVNSEEITALNFSLSRLAAIHREIIIRFYLREQPIAQIAAELDIPAGTVKRRLFDAKKNLKKGFDNMKNIGKTAYAPADVNWFWGHMAMKASILMDSSKICPQVMVICRNEAKTTNEIADEMGIAPIYLEEVLEKMLNVSLLKSPVKGKYIADCCVFPRQAYVDAQVYANEEFFKGDFPKKITEKLLSVKEKITSLDFYGNHFDYDYLMWLFYVTASQFFGIYGKERYLEKYKDKIADEAERKFRVTVHYILPDESFDNSVWDKMKSKGWSNLSQNFDTANYGKLCFVNDFELEPFPNDCVDDSGWRKGRDCWVDGNNISLLLDLAKNPQKPLNVHEQEMAAEFLKRGLLRRSGDELIVQLPVISSKTLGTIKGIISSEMKELAYEYADIVGEGLEKRLLPYVRKDLMSNFIYWDMQMFFQQTGALFAYGWNEYLAQPEDYSKSAAGLYIMTE